jgi:hypothetical protein
VVWKPPLMERLLSVQIEEKFIVQCSNFIATEGLQCMRQSGAPSGASHEIAI